MGVATTVLAPSTLTGGLHIHGVASSFVAPGDVAAGDGAVGGMTAEQYETLSHVLIYSMLLSSFLSFSWDVYMDWGLARNLGSPPRKHCGLRDRLLFRSSRVYYAIIVFNFALRFGPPMVGLRYTGPTGIEGLR